MSQVEVTNFPATGGGGVFTVFGNVTCPPGFTAIYTGTVYYFGVNNIGSASPSDSGSVVVTGMRLASAVPSPIFD
jgi:hypothetical protein